MTAHCLRCRGASDWRWMRMGVWRCRGCGRERETLIGEDAGPPSDPRRWERLPHAPGWALPRARPPPPAEYRLPTLGVSGDGTPDSPLRLEEAPADARWVPEDPGFLRRLSHAMQGGELPEPPPEPEPAPRLWVKDDQPRRRVRV